MSYAKDDEAVILPPHGKPPKMTEPVAWVCGAPGCKSAATVRDYLGVLMCSWHSIPPREATDRAYIAGLVTRTKRRAQTGGDPLAGARRLRERELAGERLSLVQKDFVRSALRMESK